jgi:hypothetical protein
MDSKGRKIIVCDNGTGVRDAVFARISYTERKIGTSDSHIRALTLLYELQFVKCGYAGANFPAHIFPSIVGRPIIRAVNKIGDIDMKVRFLSPFTCSKRFTHKSLKWNIQCKVTIILTKKTHIASTVIEYFPFIEM